MNGAHHCQLTDRVVCDDLLYSGGLLKKVKSMISLPSLISNINENWRNVRSSITLSKS